MKKHDTLDHTKNIIDVFASTYKSTAKVPYQTRTPEILTHEQFMEIWIKSHDADSGSRMPNATE
jgi:hypothetical protein